MRDIERLGNLRRQREAAADAVGKLHEADDAIGADHREASTAEFDIGDRRLEEEGGDLAPALDHLLARFGKRLPAGDHRSRTAGAAADEKLVAIALHQAQTLEGNAEPIDE